MTAVAVFSARPRAKPAAAGRFERTIAISAGEPGSRAASISDAMLEPRPEIRTATRLRVISSRDQIEVAGIAKARSTGRDRHDRAESYDRVACSAQYLCDVIRMLWVHHRNHSDAAVKRPQHLRLRNTASAGEPAEYRQHRNACEFDLRAKPVRQRARDVVGESATRDVRERLDRF